MGDIVRENEVKAAESADVADNFVAAEIKETVDNGADLGDIVRDDVVKATQIDEHSGVSDVSKYDSLFIYILLFADHYHTSHKEESWPRPSYINSFCIIHI